MVTQKELTKLNFKFQEYLNSLNIVWTIAISLFIAIISYILISLERLKQQPLIIVMLLLILVFIEIIFIAIHFWISKRKNDIKKEINSSTPLKSKKKK